MTLLAPASYAAVGGGATPFVPAVDLSSLMVRSGSLTHSCERQIRQTRRRKALDVHFSYYQGTYRLGQLYCRTGYALQLHDNGRVNGSLHEGSQFGVLEFLSVAFGLVSIRGKASQKFLCMNDKGKLYGSVDHSTECVFMERMLENYYNTYSSCAHSSKKRRWYVAMNRRGRPRRGIKSRKKKRYAQFLVLHLDDAELSSARQRPHSATATRQRPRARPSRFGTERFATNWRTSDVLWRQMLRRRNALPAVKKRRRGGRGSRRADSWQPSLALR